MSETDPFERRLKLRKPYTPHEVTDSAIWVHDTLELCWSSAQSIFKEQATPEIAIAILDKVMTKIEMERQVEMERKRRLDRDEMFE
ncbi:MAG: hypothetical protein AB4057_12705 [Crocosphaera sp.]